MNKQWFVDRMKEPSTWRGLSLLLAATGVGIAPQAVIEIGMGVAALIGIIETVRKEK